MSLPDGTALGERLRARDLTAAPEVLNLVENRTPQAREQADALLRAASPAALGGEAPGHVIGVTGPPGAGKSTLLSELVRAWRGARAHRSPCSPSIPSSKRSGGSLLGDRARIAFDPADARRRSSARPPRPTGSAGSPRRRARRRARSRRRSTSSSSRRSASARARPTSPRSPTRVVVVVQPGSGDALQFLKSGIMEIPDVLVVTKADLGEIALRARRDLHAALRSLGEKETAVVAVSSVPPATGIDDLVGALDAHRAAIDLPARRLGARRATALADFVAEHGERGLRALGGRRAARRLARRAAAPARTSRRSSRACRRRPGCEARASSTSR